MHPTEKKCSPTTANKAKGNSYGEAAQKLAKTRLDGNDAEYNESGPDGEELEYQIRNMLIMRSSWEKTARTGQAIRIAIITVSGLSSTANLFVPVIPVGPQVQVVVLLCEELALFEAVLLPTNPSLLDTAERHNTDAQGNGTSN